MDKHPKSQYSTRNAGQAGGAIRYFTGVPCKWGHFAERFVSTGGCVDCINRVRHGIRGSNVFAMRKPVAFHPSAQLTQGDRYWIERHLHDAAGVIFDHIRNPRPTAKMLERGLTLQQFRDGGWSYDQLLAHGYVMYPLDVVTSQQEIQNLRIISCAIPPEEALRDLVVPATGPGTPRA